ncbi:MAG: ABC-ATPase domain-containing protein [Wujia sp.]
MKTANELRTLLRSIDHKGYPNYKQTAGAYSFGKFNLCIDHVQGDPFASPSSLCVEVSHAQAQFPEEYYIGRREARIALQDHLTRLMSSQFEQFNFRAKGSGKSGLISITRCGQEVLERSACQITSDRIIMRFYVGFPAFGRTINAGELEKILFEFLPKCVENSMYYVNLNKKKVESAVFLAEDQQALREILRREHLVSFVANGSILPRKSGVSDLPMKDSVVFLAPDSMERTFVLPHKGEITGMAVPEGITLIVGGGYHGKSTLLSAIQQGVYNHVEGDGREFVITDETAVKLRAEDGRSIRNVDISMFINDLPNKKDTTSFTTEDASGSTSQAAGVVEGIEAGTRLFLIDEDTSATNFMVRDEFMQQVISREKEPITPFLERARDLYEQSGISTILVAGSSGAFFYIADYILQMDCYHAVDITSKVREMCKQHQAPRIQAPGYIVPEFRRVLPAYRGTGHGPWDVNNRDANEGNRNKRNQNDRNRNAGNTEKRHEHMKVKSFGRESFSLDKESVNVRYLEQLADTEQTTALAYLMRDILEKHLDGKATVQEIADTVMQKLETEDFAPFCGAYIPCGLAKPRAQELYACLNRYRG